MLRLLISVFFSFFVLACISDSTKEKIIISGEISNLPDGEMSLLDKKKIVLAKQYTNNGKFMFTIYIEDNFEPVLVELVHIDKNNVKRLFHFNTKIKKGNDMMLSQYFMLEDSVKIMGNLKEMIPTNLKIPNNIKLVYMEYDIHIGRQTSVMYNDTLRFKTIKSIRNIKKIIKSHSYSYYYLYELSNRVGEFSNKQLWSILSCFDRDVQESKTGKQLREYIEKRDSKKLDSTTNLVNNIGQKSTVLTNNASITMVILWASWCGPCRKEIPQLKKIYKQLLDNPRFSMVSVSLDNNKENWLKALDKEQMPWKQLIITPEATTYSKELFSFDGSIPTTLFVDNEGMIIKKFVGYDEKSLEEFENLIAKYIKNNK